jgi:flagellar basal-body rod protein FlgC
MDYTQAFEISASGMTVERLRMDVTAVNIANMHSTAAPDGTLFQPLRVVSRAGGGAFPTQSLSGVSFASQFEDGSLPMLRGVQVLGVEQLSVEPRTVYEPGNPSANDQGFVNVPGVDHMSEMVTLLTALRAYEANIAAMNAAKSMASKALEVGGSS